MSQAAAFTGRIVCRSTSSFAWADKSCRQAQLPIMAYTLLSLPFRFLYLAHAWLFTLDVLLLSRRRARTPVAVATLSLLLGTLLYLIVTCGQMQMASLGSFSMAGLRGEHPAETPPSEHPRRDQEHRDTITSPCVQCPDNRDWFLQQFSHLSKRIDHLHSEIQKCDCKKASYEGSQLHEAIHRALKLYDADKTGMADFALESAGGSVLSTRCSETYTTHMGRYYLFGVVPLFWKRPSPRLAIQPTLAVGECWPFVGSVGYLVLQLSRRIHVEAFTLEHIPASLALNGNIDSAPNNFEVYGMDSAEDKEGALLGSYNYSIVGEPLQHFKVQHETDKTFEFVELKILTNHGNIHYTCLYRFRVHGKPVQDETVW